MIRASKEIFFMKALENACHILSTRAQWQGDAESVIEDFASKRNEYSQYCIDMIPRLRGRYGSSNAESNYSSVISYMNDGNKKQMNVVRK